MNSILIAELFGALHGCVSDHIRAGRKEEALALVDNLQKMNEAFAERRDRFVPPPERRNITFSEN